MLGIAAKKHLIMKNTFLLKSVATIKGNAISPFPSDVTVDDFGASGREGNPFHNF